MLKERRRTFYFVGHQKTDIKVQLEISKQGSKLMNYNETVTNHREIQKTRGITAPKF